MFYFTDNKFLLFELILQWIYHLKVYSIYSNEELYIDMSFQFSYSSAVSTGLILGCE
jgi:hypothetical protein